MFRIKNKISTAPKYPTEYYAIVALFFGCLLYSFWAVTRGWSNPILEWYPGRQTQSAISVYYLLRGSDWFAYEIPTLGIPWSLPFDFPLFQWIVALIVKVLSTPIDQTGRFASLAFFYLTLFPSYSLLGTLGVRKIHRLVPLSLILVSPLYLFWSRAFMIESTALFFGVAYIACLARYLQKKSKSQLILAGLFGTLGALVKITTFVGFLFVGMILVLYQWSKPKKPKFSIINIKRHLLYFITFALIPLLAAIIWTHFADTTKAQNPLGALITSDDLIVDFMIGTVDQRFTAKLWVDTVYQRIFPDVFGTSLVLWFLLGFLLTAMFIKLPRRREAFFSLAAFIFVILLFTNLHVIHSYYQYAVGVFLIASVGFVIQGQYEKESRNKVLATVLFIAFLVAGILGLDPYLPPTQEEGNRNYLIIDTAIAVKKLTDPGEILLITGDDWRASIPYYAERKALMRANWVNWEDNAFQIALDRIGLDSIGAVLTCRQDVSIGDELLSRISSLGFNPTPSYTNGLCHIHLPITANTLR